VSETSRGTSRARAGFSLTELLIAMIIFLAVSAMMYASLQLTQRTSRAQTERSALQGNLRTAIQVLTSELKQLQVNPAAGSSDILAMSDSNVVFRSMRASGITCSVSPTSVVLRNSGGLLSLGRQIIAGRDSLLLFADRDTLNVGDDWWVALPITATPAVAACPDGSAGLVLVTSGVPVPDVLVPGPVRTFEVMQLATTRSGGQNWLGARSVSAGQALQPFLGPVDSTTGVRFAYLDAVGSVTAAPSAVRQIDVFVRTISRTPINEGVGLGPGSVGSDTLRVRVALRNSR